MMSTNPYKYISHYSEDIVSKVISLIEHNKLGALIKDRYPTSHNIRNDKALYDYVMGLKKEFMRQSPNVSKICFDPRISILANALGQHRFVSRVHGANLRASSEIRISSIFIKAPLAFLRMIVVHELAHLREKDHNKAFYRLCERMEPDYHTIEFDMRLFLTHTELCGTLYD